MEQNPKQPIPPEFKRFFSKDPYQVLGVPRTATKKEIKDARTKLLQQFHPDVNQHPLATRISQKISAAYGALQEPQRQQPHAEPPSSPPPPPRPSPTTEKKKGPEVRVRGLYMALRTGPLAFKIWVDEAKEQGYAVEKIRDWVKSEEAQIILKTRFRQGIKYSWSDHPEACILHIQEWKEVGINMSGFVKDPEVVEALQKSAVLKTKYLNKDPAGFLKFTEGWKRAGVDPQTFLDLPEAKKPLEAQAVRIIKFGGENPGQFITFVNGWKAAGFNLQEVINSEESQKALGEKARIALRYVSRAKFETFMREWMNAGWKPRQEILNWLEKN